MAISAKGNDSCPFVYNPPISSRNILLFIAAAIIDIIYYSKIEKRQPRMKTFVLCLSLSAFLFSCQEEASIDTAKENIWKINMEQEYHESA